MRIAIIGVGGVGSTLGKAWARCGHAVVFGVRDPGAGRHHALLEAAPGSRDAAPAEAAASAEVVVLATPWSATEHAVRSLGDLAGRMLVDCTNPLTPDFTALEVGHSESAAERVAEWVPGARVVKAFNTTGWNNMADPRYGDDRADMFVCGDDRAARVAAMRLAEDLGFEAIDCGPLRNARLLEPLAMLWVWLAFNGLGRDFAFKLLRR